MKREYPASPLVGVGAIIIARGRVLLVKRGHPPLAGEWSIPGGVLELGETLREAAIREAREETCLAVEPSDLLGVYDRVLRDDQGRILYHFVLIDFLCRLLPTEMPAGETQAGATRAGETHAGQAQAASDADEVRWFTLKETEALALPEDTAAVIRLGFEKSKC